MSEIVQISGRFGDDSERVVMELRRELSAYGPGAILDHLRLCGAIPESYSHDSSEEKLYSKYTDAVVAIALQVMGFTAAVLTERADAADVEAVGDGFSFVADAKAFRLSRTAKNQKDFKVQAMDSWRRDKDYALVVAPLYQLPARSSQIYQQAIDRNVCILSFSHLAMLVSLAREDAIGARRLLKQMFAIVCAIPPTKSAHEYWLAVNSQLDGVRERELWRIEKAATLESIVAAKAEALTFLSAERTRIMSLSRDEAVQQLIGAHNLDGRVTTIGRVADTGILAVGYSDDEIVEDGE